MAFADDPFKLLFKAGNCPVVELFKNYDQSKFEGRSLYWHRSTDPKWQAMQCAMTKVVSVNSDDHTFTQANNFLIGNRRLF